VPLPAFATTADLQTYVLGLGQPAPTSAQQALATMLLDALSQAVREDTGQLITRGTTTATLYPACAAVDLLLPQQPVVSVGAVTVDGIAATGWSVQHGWLHNPDGWARRDADTEVTVTWTYGYDPDPADVVLYVLMATAEGLDGARQIDNERLGDYAVTFAANPPGEHLALGRRQLVCRYGLANTHMVPVGPGRGW